MFYHNFLLDKRLKKKKKKKEKKKTFSEEPANVLGFTSIDLFLLRFKNLSKSPVSFSVISIGKLANLQVHLDN